MGFLEIHHGHTYVARFVITPLFWNMENMYGNTKGSRLYLKAIATIELDDFIQEFDNWRDMQYMQNPQLFTPFMVWKGLF